MQEVYTCKNAKPQKVVYPPTGTFHASSLGVTLSPGVVKRLISSHISQERYHRPAANHAATRDTCRWNHVDKGTCRHLRLYGIPSVQVDDLSAARKQFVNACPAERIGLHGFCSSGYS